MHDHAKDMGPVMDELMDLARQRAEENTCPHCRALLAVWMANVAGHVAAYVEPSDDEELFMPLTKFRLQMRGALEEIQGEIGYGEDLTTTH